MPSQSLASPVTTQAPQGARTYPMVRALGLGDLMKRQAETPPTATSIDMLGTLSALASRVRKSWGNNKLAKEKIDLKLLQCLRERRGVYSPAALAAMQANNGGMNILKSDLTETKCRAASAWIREIVLPVGEQPWGVDPSPIPDLPDDLMKAITSKAMGQAQAAMQQMSQQTGQTMDKGTFRDLAGQLGTKLRDEAEAQITKIAKARAKNMERQIADRLAQGGYETAMDAFVEDFVTYPAAILKGPIYKRHMTLEWGAGFKPKVANNPAQSWDRVSPFDCYPAPSARDPQVGDFIERIRFRREELHDLKGLPNYKDDQIDKALIDYTGGHLEGWLWTEAERQRLEQETLYMWLSPPGVIDALNFWGSVPGWQLITWGVQPKDGEDIEPTKDYEVNVLLCGSYVLYAAMNPDPLNQRPYRKACYDEVPGAFWGRSIPDLASTSQKMCDGIACALADNMSMASGPMVWVHADRFADGENTFEIYPWKVTQLKSDPNGGSAASPGMGFWQASDNSVNLMATYEKWELRADDATGIPRYTYGNENAGGSADTATGLSMLMNNAAKGLRRAISNIDINVISKTIGQTFINEMLYNPDTSIKGDCIIVPRGAAAILVKESAQQRRLQWLQLVSQNPVLSQIIGPKYLANSLREVATSLELPVDDVVPNEDEVDQQIAAQGQAAQQQQQQQEALMQLQETLKQQSDQALQNSKTIGNVVEQSVAHALAMKATAAAPQSVKFSYDGQGNIVGGQLDNAPQPGTTDTPPGQPAAGGIGGDPAAAGDNEAPQPAPQEAPDGPTA